MDSEWDGNFLTQLVGAEMAEEVRRNAVPGREGMDIIDLDAK